MHLNALHSKGGYPTFNFVSLIKSFAVNMAHWSSDSLEFEPRSKQQVMNNHIYFHNKYYSTAAPDIRHLLLF